MKKLILTVIFLSVITLSHSQDFEPNQISFSFNGNNNYFLSADSSYFQQTGFILGWAWGYGKKMSEALNCNQAHVSTNCLKSSLKSNVNSKISFILEH